MIGKHNCLGALSLSVLCVVAFCSCRSTSDAASVSSEELEGAPNGSHKLKVVYNSGFPRAVESSGQTRVAPQLRVTADVPGASAPTGAGSAAPSKRDVAWDVPSNWQVESPSSAMRLAQYRVARVGSDSEDAEITVFYFGASGAGGVEENLSRWVKMFDPDAQAKAKRSESKAGEQPVHVVDVLGTYQQSMAMPAPGAQQNAESKAGMSLVGAVVQTALGPYYFKLLGQQKTVEGARSGFLKMVQTTRLAGAGDGGGGDGGR